MFDVQTRGAGDEVIVLHGSPAPVESFGPLLEWLADERRVVAPELAGIDMTAEEAFEPLLETLKDEEVEGAPVIGHSMGTYRALQLALSEDFQTGPLTLIGPLAVQRSEQIEAFRGLADQLNSAKEVVPVAAQMWFSEDYQQNHDVEELVSEWIDEIGGDAVFCSLRWEQVGPDLHPRLEEIGVPVRLVVGEHDEATPVEWAREIHDHLPDSELHVVEESGHFPQIERPEETVALVREVL